MKPNEFGKRLELRCRADKGHRLRHDRRWRRDGRIAHGPALAAYRIGPKRRDPKRTSIALPRIAPFKRKTRAQAS
jgi:hypothetical protein